MGSKNRLIFKTQVVNKLKRIKSYAIFFKTMEVAGQENPGRVYIPTASGNIVSPSLHHFKLQVGEDGLNDGMPLHRGEKTLPL